MGFGFERNNGFYGGGDFEKNLPDVGLLVQTVQFEAPPAQKLHCLCRQRPAFADVL